MSNQGPKKKFGHFKMGFEVTIKHNIDLRWQLRENIYNYLGGRTCLLRKSIFFYLSLCILSSDIDKAVELFIPQICIMSLRCVWPNGRCCDPQTQAVSLTSR